MASVVRLFPSAAVRRLARNEANKRLMVEQGALPLLTQGVKSTVESEKCGECLVNNWASN